MISRFRLAYSNLRKNPFTGADLAVDKAENGLQIPSSSPYFIQLVEVPRKETPTTVTVYNVTNSVWMTEVTGAPAQNQFRVDYPPPDGQGSGLVEFSSLDAGKTVNIAYKATGSPIITEFLDTLMSHPLSEAAGDMYYHEAGEIKRLAEALDIAAGKIKAAKLSAVPPVGSILPWIGGYFTGANNEGYTHILGTANTPAGANAYLNPLGYYVCDGSAPNLAASPIWNSLGRYLPKLTDDRFIQGANAVGAVGGKNANDHTHLPGTLATAAETAHTHAEGSYAVGSHYHISPAGGNTGQNNMYMTDTFGVTQQERIANWVLRGGVITINENWLHTSSVQPSFSGMSGAGSSHSHGITGATAVPSDTENRPAFLSVFFCIRVI